MRAARVLAAVALAALAGCGSSISPQLRDARNEVARAQAGPAGQLDGDALEEAERALARAEAEDDGSAREQHLAYLAVRHALEAEADARAARIALELERDRRVYGEEVAALARRTGEPLEVTRQRLERSQMSLQQQQALLAEREQELAQEALARAEEAARAREALEGLRAVALVASEPDHTVVTVSSEVLFAGRAAQLRAGAREKLAEVARALVEAEGHEIVIQAHTDDRGSEAENLRLSQRRAEVIRAVLAGEGVPVERMRALGQGESEPISGNDTPEGRASNQRVEIVVRPAADETELSPVTPTTPTTPSGARPGSSDAPGESP